MTTRFAWKMVKSAPGAENFLIRHVDGILRFGMGDGQLVESLLVEDFGEILFAALLALLDDLEFEDSDVTALLAEAEHMVGARPADLRLKPGDIKVSDLDYRRYQLVGRRYLADKDWLPSRPEDIRPPRDAGDEFLRGEPATLTGRHVRAVLLRDSAQEADLDDLANIDLLRVVRSTFAIMINRYLYPDPDVREIDQLVARAHPGGSEPDFLKVEYLARTAMREKPPMDGLTGRDVYMACWWMLAVITDDWGRDEAAITSAVLEAEEAVAESGHRLR
ncbi:hypothetical protein AB0F72_21465 [Actinoplanes sp. NPDC023936]|uniref:hypothetical protein n=1 Tax=Actinoplanes sp. NPDC023936 TaxID=3154910 RepID=UPI003406734A